MEKSENSCIIIIFTEQIYVLCNLARCFDHFLAHNFMFWNMDCARESTYGKFWTHIGTFSDICTHLNELKYICWQVHTDKPDGTHSKWFSLISSPLHIVGYSHTEKLSKSVLRPCFKRNFFQTKAHKLQLFVSKKQCK